MVQRYVEEIGQPHRLRPYFPCHAATKDHDFVFTRYARECGDPSLCMRRIIVGEK